MEAPGFPLLREGFPDRRGDAACGVRAATRQRLGRRGARVGLVRAQAFAHRHVHRHVRLQG